MQKHLFLKYTFLIMLLFLVGGICISFEQMKIFESDMLINYSEIEDFNKSSFPSFLTTQLDQTKKVSTQNQDISKSTITLNLFGFLKIKTVDVNVVNNDVVLCGNTIGVYIENNGVTVVGFGGVKSGENTYYPFKNTNIKVGDVIKSINNTKIRSSKDIDYLLNSSNYNGEEVVIEYTNGKSVNFEKLYPIRDSFSNQYKLGLWIRENASGIGTLTFITQSDRFGALGHGITENGQNSPMIASGGSLHQCNVLGVTKSKRGNAGEIKASFKGGEDEGIVEKNNEFGVFGTVKSDTLFKKGNRIEVGGKLTAKPGKAYIYCQLDDEDIMKYEIEIIKTNYQTKSTQKSMVIRITDKRLLNKTGGIIQGMSGSPIVQNDKIVGAVTHVFVNDPTKGFAIYLDWMLNQ